MRSEQGWEESSVGSGMSEKGGMADHRMFLPEVSLFLGRTLRKGCMSTPVNGRSKFKVLEEGDKLN